MPHFLASKSLFWCNLLLTTLSEYPLDFRFLLYILLYPVPSNCCFVFDFLLFSGFFYFFLVTTTLSLITSFHPLVHAFSLVLVLNFLFALSRHWCFFFNFDFFKISFWTFCLWSSCIVFYKLTRFLWFSCCWQLLLFALGNFWLHLCFVITIFLLQCNLIINCFWLTSSRGCLNNTFQCLIPPQGTHRQGGKAHLPKMHLLNESSIWHCSFQTSSHFFVRKDISSFDTIFPSSILLWLSRCNSTTFVWTSLLLCNDLSLGFSNDMWLPSINTFCLLSLSCL